MECANEVVAVAVGKHEAEGVNLFDISLYWADKEVDCTIRISHM